MENNILGWALKITTTKKTGKGTHSSQKQGMIKWVERQHSTAVDCRDSSPSSWGKSPYARPHLLQASYCLQMRSHGQEGNPQLPNDCEFDEFCSIQDSSQGADFQVPRGFEYHPWGHAIDDHAARVECNFSVRNFHREIHSNGFPCDETNGKKLIAFITYLTQTLLYL